MIRSYLAPMEEITGYVFRNALERHFGYVDKYFTPFISPDNRIMKTKTKRELTPSSNEGLNVVPQLLANDPALFNEAAAIIADLGYGELNINFGCPSNTVTSKFKGSGILRTPELMDRFLDGVFNGKDSVLRDHPDMRISVKTRVGYSDVSDFEKAAGVLAAYPFSEYIVHPRLKKDMYSGSPRMEMFDRACEMFGPDTAYNGDICSAHDHEELASRYEGRISAVMIGRGAVRDPGIFRQIRTGKKMSADELHDFLDDLYESYKADYDEGNAVAKLKEVWSYTVGLIEDEKERQKLFRMIIKTKNPREYRDAAVVARGVINSLPS